MLSSIIAFLTAHVAPILGPVVAGTVTTWILGRLTDTKMGETLLAKAMRQSRRAGRVVSVLGTGKLGPLWNPLEKFGTTWGRSITNEFFVGLREDNPEKLGEELDRLKAAGSVTRAAALKNKLEQIQTVNDPARDQADAAAAYRLDQFGRQSIDNALGDK